MKRIIVKSITTLNLVMVWGFVFLIVITPFGFVLATLAGFFVRRGNGVHWVARHYSRIVIRLGFSTVQIEGLENIKPGGHYIFAANHASVFDILVLTGFLPVQFRWMAKENLFSLPIYGWTMRLSGYIPINRSNPREGVRSLAKAAEKIGKGVSVVIFPEGTRSNDGQVHDFKRGGFLLATKAGLPIIPVSISGTHQIMPTKTLRVTPGPIKLVFGRPIPVQGTNRAEQNRLMTEVRKEILANFDPDWWTGGWFAEAAADV
ncbi:MAG: 1-acyl-sn-glycerol-3-phosphate acyltransferase [Deltaproteobacteria bacterium]|nr:1-acyl-sn-glycerol-3-phosphate acyltransferase [Deltaproteobacteria bacterium]